MLENVKSQNEKINIATDFFQLVDTHG